MDDFGMSDEYYFWNALRTYLLGLILSFVFSVTGFCTGNFAVGVGSMIFSLSMAWVALSLYLTRRKNLRHDPAKLEEKP